MTRTDVLKGVYFARRAALYLLTIGMIAAAINGLGLLLGVLAVLFIVNLYAGRIQSYFWSDLLAGLHHLYIRDYQTSKTHSERFLAQLHQYPWLKLLIWLGPSSHSLSAEALVLNNLAAAEMNLHEFEAARDHLRHSIIADAKCPLPYRNMGLLILQTGSARDAEPWFQDAIKHGWRKGRSDRIVKASQRRNAALTTTGRANVPTPAAPPVTDPLVTGAYIIYVLNNDTIPFEVVVAVLEKAFGWNGARAIRMTWLVHRNGRAACAGFDNVQTAQDKANEMMAFSRAEGHSLECVVMGGPPPHTSS